jgi:hypothetical protein
MAFLGRWRFVRRSFDNDAPCNCIVTAEDKQARRKGEA